MAMGNFSIALKAFENKAAGNMRTVIQKIGMEAFKRVIEKSPVDTGRFRANWGVQIGSPYAGRSEIFDKDGQRTISKMTVDVAAWNAQGRIYLCNNLAYSIPLEYGHSKVQAPAGMVRVTVAEMGGTAETVARGTR